MKMYGLRYTVDGKNICIEIDYITNSNTIYNLSTDDRYPVWIVPTKEIALDVSGSCSCIGRTEFISPYHSYEPCQLEVVEYELTPS